ncbi:hypothetical protein ACFLYO_11635 [Chloroflexota bacterium]
MNHIVCRGLVALMIVLLLPACGGDTEEPSPPPVPTPTATPELDLELGDPTTLTVTNRSGTLVFEISCPESWLVRISEGDGSIAHIESHEEAAFAPVMGQAGLQVFPGTISGSIQEMANTNCPEHRTQVDTDDVANEECHITETQVDGQPAIRAVWGGSSRIGVEVYSMLSDEEHSLNLKSYFHRRDRETLGALIDDILASFKLISYEPPS